MEIIRINEMQNYNCKTAVALGNFDGVHIGHKALINQMIAGAKEMGLIPSMLVFENHTKDLVLGKGPCLLTNNKQKNILLSQLGVEELFTMEFDNRLMRLSPEDFFINILLNKLNCELVVVGKDYRFGYKASGDTALLKKLATKYNVKVIIVEPIIYDSKIVSSTLIRELLVSGDIKTANKLLARPYSIMGQVITGKGIGGKTLGVPTANLDLYDNYVIPQNGIYMSRTQVDSTKYFSATNVGNNPTFDEKDMKIETYILDFDKDIYGYEIEVEFLEYIRDEIKFNSMKALIEQMQDDITRIREKSILHHD